MTKQPQPPYAAELPPKWENEPFEDLPPTLQRRVLAAMEDDDSE